MTRRRTTRSRARSSRPSAARRQARVPSLLILRLDAGKLQQDGLHLPGATLLASTWATLGLAAKVERVDGSDQQSLRRKLAELAEHQRAFDLVLVIGHSNAEGIRIASDQFANWETFASDLKPLSPRRLVLVACQAGRSAAANVLFRKLPKLRRIYACPVNASKDLGQLVTALVPLALKVKAPTPRQLTYVQASVLALTGGQLRHWQRDADKDNPEGELLDLAATMFDTPARQVPDLLRSLLNSAGRKG